MKIRRILTSAAMVGFPLFGAAGVSAVVAPGHAFASGYSCNIPSADIPGGSFANEDAAAYVQDPGNATGGITTSTTDYLMAYDGYESGNEEYPIYEGSVPTGTYANYGKWTVCWTTNGGSAGSYYGVVAFLNGATSRVWGTEDGITGNSSYDGLDFANYDTNAEGEYIYDFQCTSNGYVTEMAITNTATGYQTGDNASVLSGTYTYVGNDSDWSPGNSTMLLQDNNRWYC